MKKEKNGVVAPIFVLVIICIVITGALAATYQVTKPIIEANSALGDSEFAEILPESGGALTQIEVSMLENVLEVYEADNGEGYVFTVSEKGFGGEMKVMCGIDKGGLVQGVIVTEHTETPNLGTIAMEEGYISQFIGAASITIKREDGKTQIDAVSNATITSDAIFRAVNAALQQFHEMGGGA